MNALRRLLSATTFYVVTTIGLVTAVSLFFVEVNRTPEIEFEEPIDTRTDGRSLISVRARNTTDETKCPEIRIAARDNDGNDLDVVVAEPVDGDGEFSPGESIRFEGILDDVTEQEIREELDEYAVYVWEMRECR